MDLFTLITLGLSVYGSVVATAVFVHQRQRDMPAVAVSCHFGCINRREDDPDLGDEYVPVITIEAQNTGVRPVQVRAAGLLRLVLVTTGA